MKNVILHETHERAGARMIEFADWLLPVDYGSVIGEVKAVRSAAGLFDVSHMGRLEVTGAAAEAALQVILTNDVAGLANNACLYTLMCNPEGGVVDDLIVYRTGLDSFYLVVNASNLDKDKSWISEHLSKSVRLEDSTPATAMLALQGPKAVDILMAAGLTEAAGVARFHCVEAKLGGADVLAFRTGYTGEDGFELVCGSEAAEGVWTLLMAVGQAGGLAPCGLAARDVLRIEAALPLYGHEIDGQTTPVEAGLMRWVKLNKADFVGRSAIVTAAESGSARKLAGVAMDGRFVPRTDDIVRSEFGDGVVTSGTFSPTLGFGIAMAYLPGDVDCGMRVEVLVHGKGRPGVVRKLPFYSRPR